MRAFADGCSAITGTEADLERRRPRSSRPSGSNAVTMVTMARPRGRDLPRPLPPGRHRHGAVPSTQETVISQIGRAVYGSGPIYYIYPAGHDRHPHPGGQTTFADFPRLSSILARDGFMPSRSRSAASAWRSTPGSSSWPSSRPSWSSPSGAGSRRSSRCTRSESSQRSPSPRRAWSVTGSANARTGWRKSAAINAFGRGRHRHRDDHLRDRQVRPGRLADSDHHPGARGGDVLHPARVRAPSAWRRPRPPRAIVGPPHRHQHVVVPVQEMTPRGDPGHQGSA